MRGHVHVHILYRYLWHKYGWQDKAMGKMDAALKIINYAREARDMQRGGIQGYR